MSDTGETKSKRKRTTSCCVPRCGNHKKDGISFHHFPTEENLRKQWEEALKLRRPASKFMRVCSDHFNEIDFFPGSVNTRPHLKRKVIPSRNLPESGPVIGQGLLVSLRSIANQVIAQNMPDVTKKTNSNEELQTIPSNNINIQSDQENCILPDSYTSLTNSSDVPKLEHVSIKQEVDEDTCNKQLDPISNCANSNPAVKTEPVTDVTIKIEKEDETSCDETDNIAIYPTQHCEILIDGNTQDAEEDESSSIQDCSVNNEQKKKLRTHTQTRGTQTCVCPIYGVLTSDTKLEAFTGIKTFQMLDEIVLRVTEVLGTESSVNRTGLQLREKVLLTLVKLKLGLNYSVLEPLFGTTRGSNYFRELIKILFGMVENYSDQDYIRNHLLNLLRNYKEE